MLNNETEKHELKKKKIKQANSSKSFKLGLVSQTHNS